jgi:predicted transcriptional regulator
MSSDNVTETTSIRIKAETKIRIEKYAEQLQRQLGRRVTADQAINEALDLVERFVFPI